MKRPLLTLRTISSSKNPWIQKWKIRMWEKSTNHYHYVYSLSIFKHQFMRLTQNFVFTLDENALPRVSWVLWTIFDISEIQGGRAVTETDPTPLEFSATSFELLRIVVELQTSKRQHTILWIHVSPTYGFFIFEFTDFWNCLWFAVSEVVFSWYQGAKRVSEGWTRSPENFSNKYFRSVELERKV